MADKSANDEVQERAAAAIDAAQSGSNHQAGSDGDDDSVADRAADKNGNSPS